MASTWPRHNRKLTGRPEAVSVVLISERASSNGQTGSRKRVEKRISNPTETPEWWGTPV
ncbi:hypothetical protein RMSM_02254 [Rhodopirellula maiorica SM1]|uniref:Uncharacterized protein n=1 Tax=Rhodopirellula maiorica SM1 TaxID=1265738 RepID=M5RNQ0_9BACT|nr:hypothetical protein RMSM_02254 [Rhodopirellula maiorica SM1]